MAVASWLTVAFSALSLLTSRPAEAPIIPASPPVTSDDVGPMDRIERLAIASRGDTRRMGKDLSITYDSRRCGFVYDQPALSPCLAQALVSLGVVLAETDFEIAASCHTDGRGSPRHNLHLSEERCSLVKALLERSGVEAVDAYALGRTEPVAPDCVTHRECLENLRLVLTVRRRSD